MNKCEYKNGSVLEVRTQTTLLKSFFNRNNLKIKNRLKNVIIVIMKIYHIIDIIKTIKNNIEIAETIFESKKNIRTNYSDLLCHMGNNAVFQVITSTHNLLFPSREEVRIVDKIKKDIFSQCEGKDKIKKPIFYEQYIKEYKKEYPYIDNYKRYLRKNNNNQTIGDNLKKISIFYTNSGDFMSDIKKLGEIWEKNGFNIIRHEIFAHKEDGSIGENRIHENYSITSILTVEGLKTLNEIVKKLSCYIHLAYHYSPQDFQYESELKWMIDEINRKDNKENIERIEYEL